MSRYDILNTAIASVDADSDRILTLFGPSRSDAAGPRYTSASRRRARARRYG